MKYTSSRYWWSENVGQPIKMQFKYNICCLQIQIRSFGTYSPVPVVYNTEFMANLVYTRLGTGEPGEEMVVVPDYIIIRRYCFTGRGDHKFMHDSTTSFIYTLVTR